MIFLWCLLIGSSVFAETIDEYERILFTVHSGGHGPQSVSLEMRKRLLNQPSILPLLQQYGVKRMRKHYEDHLIEIAVRNERPQLNFIVRSTFPPSMTPPTAFQEEEKHMQILGTLFERYHDASYMGFELYDAEMGKKYGALALYVATEAIIRLALLEMNGNHSEAANLMQSFWYISTETEIANRLNIEAIEKVARTGLVDLVREYKNLIGSDECKFLLAARHPGSEG